MKCVSVCVWGLDLSVVFSLTRGPKAMTLRTDSMKKKVVNTMLRFFRTSEYMSEAPSNWRNKTEFTAVFVS